MPLLILDNQSADAQRDTTVETVAPVAASVTAPEAPSAPVEPTIVLVDAEATVQRASAWAAASQLAAEARVQSAVVLGEQVEALEAHLDAQQREEARRVAEAAEAERRAAEAAEAERRAAEAAEAERLAAEQAPPPPVTTVATPQPSVATTTIVTTTTLAAPPQGDGPTAEQWAALRQCEASGNYGAVNPSGKYRGAYQFSQATWDWIASLYHPELFGISPELATPAQQDTMALSLYHQQGPAAAWPVCGAVFA